MSSKVTYRQQFTRCGKQRCRKCKEGAGHGPYWYAYWSVNGRTVSKYIGKHLPEDAEIETKTSALVQTPSPVDDAANNPRSLQRMGEDMFVEIPLASNAPISSIEGASGKQPALRIYLLGQFRIVRRQGNTWQTIAGRMWQRRRARALLGCLLSNAGRRLGREQTMEALWPDLDIETAANRLNGAVHEARQILEPELARPAASKLLRLERDVLQLADADQIWVDADIFEGLLNRANGASDPAQAEQILEEAARLYGGDYLLEELYSEWAATRRESLRRGWIGLLLKLAELRAARGALPSAIEPLDRLLANDPTHETAVRRLMLLLTQLDRRGEALRVYHNLANILQRDYESDPLPETDELYEALRQGHMQIPHPVISQPALGTATPISGELQGVLSSSPESELHQRGIPSFPRPVLQFGRHNQSPLVGRDRELMILRQHLFATEDALLADAQDRKSDETGQPVKRNIGDVPGKQKNSHFLLLMGESGIGKTRLAEELSQEAYARGWSVAWTHAHEQESTIPFRPWTEVLRVLLQDSTPEILLSSLEARLIASSGDTSGSFHYPPDINSKLARLSALLPELANHDTMTPPQNASSTPLPPEQERLHLWEATLLLLNMLSRITPLLLVLDDLHWTDDSSLELLAYLVRHLQNERILLVGTCRDVELTANSNLRTLINDLRREQSVVTLSLQPLSQSEIGSLVAYLPKDIVQSIQIHAGGNPFFAEELARVSDTSLLSTVSPAAEIALTPQYNALSEEVPGGINRVVTLPETIAAVLERRLSKLSNDCLALLGKASVLGGSFEFNQLLLMAGDPGTKEDAILDLLEEALHAGLLIEEGTDGHITYHFWHPLIVSHLYDRLSAARRAQMHRRAANALLYLNQGHETELAGAITYHLSKGGSNPGQLARYAEIAGDRAFSLPAYSEAEHYYRQAIAAITGGNSPTGTASGIDPLHLAYLLEQVAECNIVKGNYGEARDLFEHVLELRNQYQATAQANASTQQSDAEAQLWHQQEAQIQALIWREIGRTWAETGDFDQARQCFEYGKHVMFEAGVTSGAAWACLHLQHGNVSWKQGNYNEARRYAQEALEMLSQVIAKQPVRGIDSQEARNRPHSTAASQTRIARALVGDPLEVGRCHEILGIITATVGHYTEALKHLDTARALYEEHGLITALTQVYGNLGAVYAFKAENAVARTYYQRALELAERNGDLPDMAFVIGNLADVAARSGDLQEAEAWFKRSIALAERINDREQLCWCHVALASALKDQGNMRSALEHIRRSLVLGRAMKSARGIGFALVALGDWRFAQAIAISNRDVINLKEQTIMQDPACYRLLLSARAAVERALSLEELDAEVLTEGHLTLAGVYFFLDDLDTAQQKAFQTLEEARGSELTRVEARSQRLLGRILAARGQHEQADKYFEQALEVFKRYEMRLDYACALHGFGVTLLRRSEPGEETYQRGLAYLHQARDIFRDCGAAIDLDWVERILANLENQNVKAFLL